MSDVRDRLYGKKERKRIFAIKANEDELLGYLSRRVSSLKQVRREFEPLWKDIRQFLEPNIGKGLLDSQDRDKVASQREDRKILNPEPRLMLHRYAAGMQSGVTNYAQQWFQFVPSRAMEDVTKRPDLKKFFAKITSRCADAFKEGNFYLVTEEVYLHSAQFGTCCCLLLHGENPGDVYLHLIDEGDYWIAEDRYQRVNTCLRRMEMTIGQAAEEFMLSNLPEGWQDKYDEGKLEERVTVWNLIMPKGENENIFGDVPEAMTYASFYWMEGGTDGGTKRVIDIRGFYENPIIAYRHQYCGSVYGKGIGEQVLPDLKQVQKIEEYDCRIIAGEAIPALQAPATLKGKVNNFPGGVTYLDEMNGTGAGKVSRLFETHNAIEAIEGKMQTVIGRIGRAFYNDLFSAMLNITSQSAKQMTAREVNEISAEKVTLLGPVLTRMDHDFLGPATDNCLGIQFRDGYIDDIPTDIEFGEVDVTTEYVSTIHVEMKANLKKRGLFNVLDVAGMVAQFKQDVMDKIDGDQIIDEISALHPESGSYIRSDEDAEKIRAIRAQAAQDAQRQAALLEMAKNAGKNAKALSEAKVGGGNMLDVVTQGGVM